MPDCKDDGYYEYALLLDQLEEYDQRRARYPDATAHHEFVAKNSGVRSILCRLGFHKPGQPWQESMLVGGYYCARCDAKVVTPDEVYLGY